MLKLLEPQTIIVWFEILEAIQELLDEDVREAKRELEYLIQEVHGVTKTR